jgi:hypothetical protein
MKIQRLNISQVDNEKKPIAPIREKNETKEIETINEKEIKQIKEDKNVGVSTSDEEKKPEVSRAVLVVLAATVPFIVGLTVYGYIYTNPLAPVLAGGLGALDFIILNLQNPEKKNGKNESSKN